MDNRIKVTSYNTGKPVIIFMEKELSEKYIDKKNAKIILKTIFERLWGLFSLYEKEKEIEKAWNNIYPFFYLSKKEIDEYLKSHDSNRMKLQETINDFHVDTDWEFECRSNYLYDQIKTLNSELQELKKSYQKIKNSPQWIIDIFLEFNKPDVLEKKIKVIENEIFKIKNQSMISEDIIERCGQVPIYLFYDGKKLKTGKGFFVSCPFHNEKTPSCELREKGGFKCYGCDEWGDTITFVRKRDGYSFREAIDFLERYI